MKKTDLTDPHSPAYDPLLAEFRAKVLATKAELERTMIASPMPKLTEKGPWRRRRHRGSYLAIL